MGELSNDALLYEKSGHIVTLTINHPELRNALGAPEDVVAWPEAMSAINADRDVRAVILTGAGKAFSAGGNVKAMKEKGGGFGGPGVEVRESYRNGIHRIVKSLWGIEVPVIGAINGPAIGLGCDVACLTDTRIASQNAKFGVTFLKLGLIPGDGGAWILPRAIGMSRASELFYTGDVIDADQAMAWGLVNRVVPAENLIEEALAVAGRIAEQPPQALRMTKQLIRAGMNTTYETVLEMSASMQALAHHTEDHMEAIDAFFEKRSGKYTGR